MKNLVQPFGHRWQPTVCNVKLTTLCSTTCVYWHTFRRFSDEFLQIATNQLSVKLLELSN